MDGLDEDASGKLWNIFHDLYITDDAVDMIRKQAEKLVCLLESLETWENSFYGKVLRIVNEETLESLLELFTSYSNAERTIYTHFKPAVNKVFREHYIRETFFPTLTRSFGVLATASLVVAAHHTQQFWEFGVTDLDDMPKSPLCNPLFVYSSTAGTKFA